MDAGESVPLLQVDPKGVPESLLVSVHCLAGSSLSFQFPLGFLEKSHGPLKLDRYLAVRRRRCIRPIRGVVYGRAEAGYLFFELGRQRSVESHGAMTEANRSRSMFRTCDLASN
jgi:hypothetical protein